MKRTAINPETGTRYDIDAIASEFRFTSATSIYRDRISGNREGSSVIAWYLQPLPDTRPSYSESEHNPVFA